MTTPRRESAELTALRAERDRLSTVTDVLSDIFRAASDTARQKGDRDCTAEAAKRDHWRRFHKPALAEYLAAADAYGEVRWGSKFVAKSRAEREPIHAGDPEMRELIVKARTDLAARRASEKSAKRDRRRSR
ncbi:hypothetical protein [Nocardia sp. NPDC059228]|uniref:hypothetical protein n=1 Tax=Nocardia sp. NPDC059228 TaxID=3346777 RepID=UPI00367F116D